MNNVILPKKTTKLQLLEFEAFIVSSSFLKNNKLLDVVNYSDFVKFGHPLVRPYAAALEFYEEIDSNNIIRDVVFTSDFISVNASFIDFLICIELLIHIF